MKKIALLILILSAVGIWYFDAFHEPVETIDDLIGKNLDFANKVYFKSEADEITSFNINNSLNEFQGGIVNKKSIITDSIVYQYTWKYLNHKETIWVAKTKKQDLEIVDAIRYKKNVKF
ncbi:hypothetical protein DI487_13250 [Flavobacterium sediminis]|uniref:Uncharacterized protein n=1 Tax=Flavobacterium sediminis TaxID=2201181 RepID=A0A2U8QX28_9FLAO|nr:hypothetical protein [Flavobacterium sediminis]AWM14728.1 hypothetical protein DI487_13250 [Flavobacterium sediminis]